MKAALQHGPSAGGVRKGTRGLELPVFTEGPAYKEKPANYVLSGHRHPSFEIFYIDRGTVQVLQERTGCLGQTGQLFLLFPDQKHVFWAANRIAPNIVNIHFLLPPRQRGYAGLERFRFGPVPTTAYMRDRIGRMLTAWRQDTARSRSLAAVHLAELLLMLADSPDTPAVRPNRRITENSQAHLAELTRRFIAAHLAEPLTVAEIATALSMGESTLRHAFKQATGSTITCFLSAQRIQRAKELLRESSLNITQIAPQAGYRTIYAFSRAFRRCTGMSPGEYSRSVRNELLSKGDER